MKKTAFLIALPLLFAACGGKKDNNNTTTTPNNDANQTTHQNTPAPDANISKIPFIDFPNVNINAEAGCLVLTPNELDWINIAESATAEEANDVSIDMRVLTLVKPGAGQSDIQDHKLSGEAPFPRNNAAMIVIPKGQTAKKGDIVLSHRQNPGDYGMFRGIVVDDSKPAEPVVRDLDTAWDFNTKDATSGKSKGQTYYPLAANSFVKITDPWQPGNLAVSSDGEIGNILNISGDKVLVYKLTGRLAVFSKAACKPMPLKPALKVGSKAYYHVNGDGEGDVLKVDETHGVYTIKSFMYPEGKPYSLGYVSDAPTR